MLLGKARKYWYLYLLFFPTAVGLAYLYLRVTPKKYEAHAVLLIKGRLDKSEEEAPKFIAMEVSVPDLSTGEAGPVVVHLPAARCIPPVVDRFKETLAAHPGVTEVRLAIQNGPRTTVVRLDDALRVTPSPALYADLKALLGPSCLQ